MIYVNVFLLIKITDFDLNKTNESSYVSNNVFYKIILCSFEISSEKIIPLENQIMQSIRYIFVSKKRFNEVIVHKQIVFY